MMVTLALSPRAFLPPSVAGSPSFFALMIVFLRDLEENGIIIIDGEPARATFSAITSILETWPQKYRTQAKEILSRLRHRNRLVSVRDVPETSACGSRECRYVLGLTSKLQLDAILSTAECEANVRSKASPVEVFTLQDYPLSRFSSARQGMKRFCIVPGVTTQEEAERQVFEPVMRHAKHVSLIDRYIGRGVAGGNGQSPALSRGYQASLSWLCDVLQKRASCRESSKAWSLEIWCGLDSRSLAPSAMSAAASELRRWETQMVSSGAAGLKLHIKKETFAGEMPHARYLITNQLALLVDRGFELLHGPSSQLDSSRPSLLKTKKLRDCEIVLLSDAGRVLTEIRKLPDV